MRNRGDLDQLFMQLRAEITSGIDYLVDANESFSTTKATGHWAIENMPSRLRSKVPSDFEEVELWEAARKVRRSVIGALRTVQDASALNGRDEWTRWAEACEVPNVGRRGTYRLPPFDFYAARRRGAVSRWL